MSNQTQLITNTYSETENKNRNNLYIHDNQLLTINPVILIIPVGLPLHFLVELLVL